MIYFYCIILNYNTLPIQYNIDWYCYWMMCLHYMGAVGAVRSLEKTKYTGNFAAMTSTANNNNNNPANNNNNNNANNPLLAAKSPGLLDFDGSGSDSSDSESSSSMRRKKLKT